jgi:hypothetical protein
LAFAFTLLYSCPSSPNTRMVSQTTNETRFYFQEFEYADYPDSMYVYCNTVNNKIVKSKIDWKQTHCICINIFVQFYWLFKRLYTNKQYSIWIGMVLWSNGIRHVLGKDRIDKTINGTCPCWLQLNH